MGHETVALAAQRSDQDLVVNLGFRPVEAPGPPLRLVVGVGGLGVRVWGLGFRVWGLSPSVGFGI